MRRVWGAWLVFIVIAGPHAVDLVRHDYPFASPADLPPFAATTGATPPDVPAAFSADPLVYLSTAPPESLTLLPGIGPVLAARIAQARSGKSTFISWEELQRVQGIGPKRVARLKAASGADR